MEIHLFVEEPFPFDEAFARAEIATLGDAHATVAAVADLIRLKRVAGRPKDLEDIRVLELMHGGTDD